MKIGELDIVTKNYVLESKLRQASNAYSSTQYSDHITTECIYCGERRQKGTLYKANTGRWCYICWKASCCCSTKAISAEKWLKRANSALYASYIRELKEICTKETEGEWHRKAEEARIEADKKQKEEVENKIREDNEATKFFKPLCVPGRWQKRAKEFCRKRLIPKEYVDQLYYSDEGKYRGRIIIPFRNANNKIVFWQGRALYDTDCKYLSKIGNTALFDISRKDKSKPLVITEGPIDSMFIENATATVGASSSAVLDSELKDYERYWLYDNDEAGQKAAGRKVLNKEYVFLWKKFLNDWNIVEKIKDINDVVLVLNRTRKFKFEELKDYFTNVRDIFLMYA